MKNNNSKTHFGFKEVETSEKAHHVASVFHSVAQKYDVMNDLMSLGIHRLWKKFAIDLLSLRPGHMVLDIAGGTGDLAAKISKKIGPTGKVVLSDINSSMLSVGKDRMLDSGIFNNITYAQADAEKLPFANNTFDRLIIGFGLRNVRGCIKIDVSRVKTRWQGINFRIFKTHTAGIKTDLRCLFI